MSQRSRRWSLPARAPSTAAAAGLVSDLDNSDLELDGVRPPPRAADDIETSRPNRRVERRNTVIGPTAAIAQERTFEDEVNLAIIYAQLNEVFGVDFGANFGEAFPIDAEDETVTCTCTESSCDLEGNPTNARRAAAADRTTRRRQSSITHYALDPDTGAVLPVATPVGIDEFVDADCSMIECVKLIACILAVPGIIGIVVLLIYLLDI